MMKSTQMQGVRWRDRALIGYSRLPEHPAKQRILQCAARMLNPRPMVSLPGGARLRLAFDDYLGWALLHKGDFEPRTQALAASLLRQAPGLFIDVGANIGYFSVAMATIPGVQVIAIEPDPSNCHALRENIELNGYSNIKVFSGGISDRVGLGPMSRRHAQNSGTAHFSEQDGRARDWSSLVPMSQVVDGLGFEGCRPVVIKIDVEGFERKVLDGIDWEGASRPMNIIMEYNEIGKSTWGSINKLGEFFYSRGYSASGVDGAALGADALVEDNVWARDRRL